MLSRPAWRRIGNNIQRWVHTSLDEREQLFIGSLFVFPRFCEGLWNLMWFQCFKFQMETLLVDATDMRLYVL